MKKYTVTALFILFAFTLFGQNVTFKKQEFELNKVKASVVKLKGQEVLKVERDLEAFPFDKNKMASTVDEPTYARLKGVNLENGIIEVKVLSRLLKSAPDFARGFIGIAFRANDSNTSFQSIYIRPTNGRANNQFRRNHTVQYFSYPDYKFDRLRKEFPEMFETYADIGLDEWITLRLEINDRKTYLYINGQKNPSFIVDEMKGGNKSGSVALWVDIGTEGYFKDLKITKQ
ncbi:hypothetical protein [Niabella drilacis]|uniref:3-keto-disaccharide hydrolase domain-containing protein n=1 Tax=Niabella drilacis (strain DSM 25811 / CCM 8410 / CCUG 62505 / LMG 26954 / E90) TaxID=1285928 RepID=A0A1G6MRV6_NIADE|nr:hypothetical protein [Niabella drilacis]SDC58191.1 hypothetical protein SAMN04487894_10312 [Niabella drilacis]